MSRVTFGVLFVALIAFFNVNANELVLTQEKGGESRLIIDFIANDSPDVVAMDFEINLGKKMVGKVDLNNCALGLPKTHIGKCAYKEGGVIRMVVFSPTLDYLPTGEIGYISVRGLEKSEGLSGIEFSSVHMSDRDARDVQFTTLQ